MHKVVRTEAAQMNFMIQGAGAHTHAHTGYTDAQLHRHTVTQTHSYTDTTASMTDHLRTPEATP